EARLVVQGNLARLLVVHCRDCAGQEGGVLREVPETDLAERRGNHSVIKLFALGLEVKFVALIAPVDFYLASLILVLKPRDLAAESDSFLDKRHKCVWKLVQALVDSAPCIGAKVH